MSQKYTREKYTNKIRFITEINLKFVNVLSYKKFIVEYTILENKEFKIRKEVVKE